MAQRLTPLVAGGVLCLVGGAHAQALTDPMRPPGVAAAGIAAPEAEAGSPRLESVLISPQRRLAVINGHTVPLGGRIGDATLVKIGETSVVLKRGDALETLALLPGVEKKASGNVRVRGNK